MTTTIIDRHDLPKLLAQYGGLQELTGAALDQSGCQSVGAIVAYLDELAANSRAKVARRQARGQETTTEELIARTRQDNADALRTWPDMRYHVVSAIFGTAGCCGLCGHEWVRDPNL